MLSSSSKRHARRDIRREKARTRDAAMKASALAREAAAKANFDSERLTKLTYVTLCSLH
jgi:hypothetical protein